MLARLMALMAVIALLVIGMPVAMPTASAQTAEATVTTDNLNVRARPGTTSEIVGTFPLNQVVSVSGREDQQGNGGLWVVASANNLTGWVLIDYLQFASGFNYETLPIVSPDGAPVSGAPAQNNAAPEQPQAATAVPAAPAGNNPPPLPSTNIGGFSYGAHVANFNNVNLMQYSGMTWVKFQVRHNPGANPAEQQWLIDTAHANGLRILLGVVGAVEYINGGEAYYSDYANYVAGLAGLGADAIEIWNEPNLDREWPAGLVSGANYTQLLARSYNAIKAVSRNTIVISGAPAPTGFFGGCTPNGCDDAPFLAQMRDAGAASYMDCVGAHYNEGVVSPYANSGDPRSEFYTRYLPGMISTYYSIMRKPVCFTELGYVTGEGYGSMPPGFEWGGFNTLAEHAQWLADAVSISAADSRVRLLIIWNLNYPSFSGDPAGGYAMIRPDGSCPACDALARRR